MKYYFGVDGGGTKTKYLLANEIGEVVASFVSGTTHYMQVGLDGLTNGIKEGLEKCLEQANIQYEEIVSSFVATGGYGAISSDKPLIDEAIRKALPNIKLRVGNDMENAYSGSLSDNPGINVIAGTGSIGLGINEEKESLSSGGWGPSFGGDEGSAYWLASKLLIAFSRQTDLRDERTFLYDYMMEKYKLENGFDILKIVMSYQGDRTKLASFATDLYEVAKVDEAGRKIYEDAARELADIYIAIKNNLKFANTPVLASYTGGVFNAKELITKPLEDILAKEDIKLVAPLATPDIGSIVLAMTLDNLEITEEIKNNLVK